MDHQLVEQVVPKFRGVRYRLNIFFILLGVIAIPGLCIALAYILGVGYLIIVAMFLLMFSAYGAWFFITRLRVEYEYAFLSSVLRIDKIIARRSRRPIVKVDVKQLDDFFPFTDEAMSMQKFAKVYHAAGREFSEENYVAVFHSEAKGRSAILFTPNEQLIAAMKPYFSNTLRKKLLQEKRL